MGILPDAQTGTCAVVDVQTSFVPGVVRMSETKMLETMAKQSTVGSARKIAFRVIGPKELTELVDMMTILPPSTTGWFVVISLRLLRRIDSRVLGQLFTMVQRLMSKT